MASDDFEIIFPTPEKPKTAQRAPERLPGSGHVMLGGSLDAGDGFRPAGRRLSLRFRLRHSPLASAPLNQAETLQTAERRRHRPFRLVDHTRPGADSTIRIRPHRSLERPIVAIALRQPPTPTAKLADMMGATAAVRLGRRRIAADRMMSLTNASESGLGISPRNTPLSSSSEAPSAGFPEFPTTRTTARPLSSPRDLSHKHPNQASFDRRAASFDRREASIMVD
jgi:hypothetical protein